MVVTKTLRAASGWLDLGLADEALFELQSLPTKDQTSKNVLEVKVHAQMEIQSWNAASETARLLCVQEPQNAEFFLRAAFCLHETGDTLAARNWLLRGPKTLLELPAFHYNLGCYLWVLGERKVARDHLAQAFSMDESLQDFALQDRDLSGLEKLP
jgi:Flp pilus assembly protein TadD